MLISSLSIAAVMGIIAILFPGMGRTQERILITSLLVGVFSLPALACAIVMGRKTLVWFMWSGIVATLVALFLWLLIVWVDFWRYTNSYDWAKFIAKAATPCTIIAGLAMQTGLLMLMRMQRTGFAAVRIATIVCASLLGGLVWLIVWTESFDSEAVGKTIAVLAILAACGTVVSPVLALIDMLQRRGGRESIPSRVQIALTCPRCQHQQMLPAGSARCAKCGLRIDIDVEEPRCSCGYLLYQLQSDKCPECGTAVMKV